MRYNFAIPYSVFSICYLLTINTFELEIEKFHDCDKNILESLSILFYMTVFVILSILDELDDQKYTWIIF